MSEHKDSLFRNSWALKVTDRGLSEYEELAHFKHQNIPQRGIVLNIGSGLYQTFEEELKVARPDLQVVSIDPSLSLTEQNFVAENADGKQVTLDNRERRESLSKTGNSVSAVGQRLPFKDDTFDVAFDIHGPAQYSKDESIYKEYLREAVRVLKPGGKLHIFNTYLGDPLKRNQEDEKKLIEMQQKIFKDLGLNAEVFLQTERIRQDNKGNNVEDKRVGVIITK